MKSVLTLKPPSLGVIQCFFPCVPQDSQSSALLELGTANMLHAYWITDTDEI